MTMTVPLSVDLEKENRALREELRQARAELRRVDQMKRDFITLASHELRSPLAILLGYAKIVEDEATEQVHEHATIVTTHAWRLKSIVDAMITLEQLNAGEISLHFKPVLIAEAIQTVVEERQRELYEKALTCDVQADAGLLVRADRERLGLILTYLVANAIRYSPRGETIRIGARADGTRVITSIRDAGIGIPSEELPRIFNLFDQVDDPLTRYYNGLGLGLAVARALVELHNGEIRVESALNQGSTFSFSLPRVMYDNGHERTE